MSPSMFVSYAHYAAFVNSAMFAEDVQILRCLT